MKLNSITTKILFTLILIICGIQARITPYRDNNYWTRCTTYKYFNNEEITHNSSEFVILNHTLPFMLLKNEKYCYRGYYGKCYNVYEIVHGDTCSKISKRFGISLSDIKYINPEMNCNSLRTKDKICVSFERQRLFDPNTKFSE